jgi:hypothetical protein
MSNGQEAGCMAMVYGTQNGKKLNCMIRSEASCMPKLKRCVMYAEQTAGRIFKTALCKPSKNKV